MKDKIIEFLNNKRILIIGYGREGKSAYKFIKDNLVKCDIGIADQSDIVIEDNDVKLYTGENYLEAIKDYDLAIKSPGIIIKNYIDEDQKEKITSLTDMFLRFCPNKIVGVTGTKGKSTTSSLIYHILKENGFDTYLIGNIGLPCFDVIDKIKEDTVLVYELSCHQLEYVKTSPDIAVLLNLYEEHLDHYIGINEYIAAKQNIYKYQTSEDYLIYGDIWNYMNEDDLSKIKSKQINIDDNPLGLDFNEIKTSLIGDHNKKNILTALIVANLFGIDKGRGLKAVETFKGLEHRLEYVGTFKGIKFYNDSIATAQEAVINAVESLKDVDTIILGGMDRGLNYTKLVKYLSTSSVENIILLPATNKTMKETFDEFTNTKHIYEVKDMEEAVKVSYEVTKENKTCLLSPAAASYGFYLNFEKRGEHFKKLVTDYSK